MPQDLELLSIDFDGRLHAYCVNARSTYEWFLLITRGAERNLEIQRQIIRGTKSYQTLRADLKRGCVLPPLVLAVKGLTLPPRLAQVRQPFVDLAEEQELLNTLVTSLTRVAPSNVYIIDGLQRTNAILQTREELPPADQNSFLTNRVRFEIWINIPFGALAYRMLLLNAGQRPMSIKHQVEILSMKLSEELSSIQGIEILTALEGRRRTRKGQFNLALLSQAFQAWLQGQPNVDLRNLVMEQLLAESAIDTLGAALGDVSPQDRDSFKRLVEWLVSVDYKLPDTNEANQFLANDTVLQGIGAAVGAAERNSLLRDRKERGLEALMQQLRDQPQSDPLGIEAYERVRKGIDPSRVNVGQATRNMVFGAFREFFLSDGTKTMQECWEFAAGQT